MILAYIVQCYWRTWERLDSGPKHVEISRSWQYIYSLLVWFEYDLRQKYYTPQVQPNQGSAYDPPYHDSTFHVTVTPALTTWPSVTSVAFCSNCPNSHYSRFLTSITRYHRCYLLLFLQRLSSTIACKENTLDFDVWVSVTSELRRVFGVMSHINISHMLFWYFIRC